MRTGPFARARRSKLPNDPANPRLTTSGLRSATSSARPAPRRTRGEPAFERGAACLPVVAEAESRGSA